MQIFDRSPRNRQPVVGRSAAANFIQQDQRPRRRRVQDRRRLRHLDHESRAAARQIVARADAGEHAVDHAQPRRARRNERAHLRQNHDQRRLPQVGRLAAHVRPGQQQNVVRSRIQIKIVGHEALAASRHFLLLDHRMPAFDNFEIAARHRTPTKLRPAVIAQRRDVRQRSQHIDFRQRQRSLPNSLGLGCNRGAQFGKQPPLDLDDLFLCVENLGSRILSIPES